MDKKIEQGQLYKVTTDTFFTSGDKTESRGLPSERRRVGLLPGEIIEIRYPYEWHFRTIEGEYFHASPKMIKENAQYVGKIWDNVKFGNNCSLFHILYFRLYEPVGSYHSVIPEAQLKEWIPALPDSQLIFNTKNQ